MSNAMRNAACVTPTYRWATPPLISHLRHTRQYQLAHLPQRELHARGVHAATCRAEEALLDGLTRRVVGRVKAGRLRGALQGSMKELEV